VADGGIMGRKEEIVLELISYKIVMDLLDVSFGFL
jgi:hypothetical protein